MYVRKIPDIPRLKLTPSIEPLTAKQRPRHEFVGAWSDFVEEELILSVF